MLVLPEKETCPGRHFWTFITKHNRYLRTKRKDSLVTNSYGLRCTLFMTNQKISSSYYTLLCRFPLDKPRQSRSFFGKIAIIKRALKNLAFNKLFHPTEDHWEYKCCIFKSHFKQDPFLSQQAVCMRQKPLTNQISEDIDKKSCFFRFTLMTFLLFQNS